MFKIIPCTWGEDLQQRIYRDYGWHCKKQRYFKNAIQQFQKSAEIEKDEMLLQKRGYTHYENIEIEEALADAREGLELRSSNYKMAKLQNNCVIAQNKFEEEIKLISNQVVKFGGLKKKLLNTYLTTRNENYLNIIGPPSGPCLLKLQNAFHRIPPKPVAPDITPKWKLLKNGGICDCESIMSFGGKSPSLLDKVKQRKGYRVFTQQYMGPSSHDLEYLQMLCDNSTLFSAPLPHPDLQADIRKDYGKAWRVVKMLHANMPVYSLYQAQFGTAERMQAYRKKYILRLQYLARREVFNLLQTIREVATRNDHEALLNLVDKVVGITLPLKTHAILPRKNDFINEISNIIALFYVNRLTYPSIDSSEIEVEDCKAVLYKMLDIDGDKVKGIPPDIIFGDKSTYVDPDEPDYAFLAYKKRVVVYEKRAADTKFFMEKCFLLHEAARSHLDSGNFDDAKNFADRVLNEAAKSCESFIWSYLALLVLCRSDVITGNIIRGRDNFLILVKLSKTLKSPFLIKVSTYASELNKKLCEHQEAHSISLPPILPPAK